MIVTILDPCTGTHVKVEIPVRKQPPPKVRHWIIREIDRTGDLNPARERR